MTCWFCFGIDPYKEFPGVRIKVNITSDTTSVKIKTTAYV